MFTPPAIPDWTRALDRLLIVILLHLLTESLELLHYTIFSIPANRAFEEELQLPVDPPPVTKSYEELRRQNREDYARRQQAPYRPPTVLEDTPPIRRETVPPPRLEDRPPQHPQMKNKYGDVYQE